MVCALKPVESGTDSHPEEQQDGVLLAQATGQKAPRKALQTLKAPLAPPDAARVEGVELRYDEWVATVHAVAEDADIVLVEGAGGLLSPLTWDAHALSLAKELDADVLVVAPDKLGVQNHVRLVHRVLSNEGVNVIGVVLSAPRRRDEATGRNQAVLERVMPGVRITSLGRHDEPTGAHPELESVLQWFGVGD